MRIANWSIPGITSPEPLIRQDRQCRLLEWLQESRPRIDVVALQKVGIETKFPCSELREIGYRSVVNGSAFRGDFGVAILSHVDLPAPRERFRVLPGAGQDGARLLTVEIADFRFSSIYAPYGRRGNVPGIERRVAWLRRLREHVVNEDYANRESLLCGDFNVQTKSDGPPKGDEYSEAEQNELENLLDPSLFADLYDEYRGKHSEAGRGCTFHFTKKYPEGSSRLHLAIASTKLAR